MSTGRLCRKVLNGVEVPTICANVELEETLVQLEVGNTGFQSDNKSRAYFRIECMQGDFFCKPIFIKNNRMVGFEFMCGGNEAIEVVSCVLSVCDSLLKNHNKIKELLGKYEEVGNLEKTIEE